MQIDAIEDARRQVEICNACRYCEGYCAVFPELRSRRMFTDGDITHLASLCHDCRGCYYACQYTAPHEFDLNLPAALAQVRRESWEDYAWPQTFARVFHRSGVAVSIAFVASFAAIFMLIQGTPATDSDGFYAMMSHSLMVAIFGPAFILPLISICISLARFWADIGGGALRASHVVAAIKSAATMKHLGGGHGEGCNFEGEDRFSQGRKHAHHLVMYGFLLCFLSTASGTILHYGLGWQAPYGFWSPPKLLGVPGGLLMVAGTVWMAKLKLGADPRPGDKTRFGGDMAFIFLLLFTALSGLVLYLAGSTNLVAILLAFHLGSVLCLFVLLPFSKMVHGFYRLLALAKARS